MPAMPSRDPVLADIEQRRIAADDAVTALYAAMMQAKVNGYSYNELETATGLPRGTVQNIVIGNTPKYTIR